MNNQNKSEGLGETITISKYLFITYPIVKPRVVWSRLTTTKKIWSIRDIGPLTIEESILLLVQTAKVVYKNTIMGTSIK
ncbi:MAG: hypothetical protein EBQ89_03800 [Alphaproteobacteria bacterium]|nr:hypothetical protein [Alphaproteobacteria bacterium]